MKGISQIKPRLGQGRAGLRCKIKPLMPLPINKTIVKLIEHPKVVLKVRVQENSRIHDKIMPIPGYEIPHTRSKHDSSSRMVKRKTIKDVSREIPIYPDPTYRPPPKPVKLPIPEVPRRF